MNLSFSNSEPNSKAKDENVVKPPRNPGIRKYLMLSAADQCKFINSDNIPIVKHPKRLIIIICNGIPITDEGKIVDKATRNIEPNAPPRPTTI